MSSKNNARPARRPKGNLWMDLDRLHNECVSMTQVPAQVAPLLRNVELHKYIDDLPSFTTLASLLNRDTQDFIGRLNVIHQRHAGRSHTHNGNDGLMLAIDCHETYLDWIEKFQNVVLTVVNQINGIAANAAEKYEAAKVSENTSVETVETPELPVAVPVDNVVDIHTIL